MSVWCGWEVEKRRVSQVTVSSFIYVPFPSLAPRILNFIRPMKSDLIIPFIYRLQNLTFDIASHTDLVVGKRTLGGTCQTRHATGLAGDLSMGSGGGRGARRWIDMVAGA